MKPTLGLFLLTLVVVFLWNSPNSGPSAAPTASPAPAAGPWTTGAVGTLGDVVYGPGEHYIDLATGGLYDPVLWIVILDYNTLTIQQGAIVRFLNHPTRAPVVIRALGEIVIDGELNLDGGNGHVYPDFPRFAEPGPGGFRGGIGERSFLTVASDGHGPGGGLRPPGVNTSQNRASGSHSTMGMSNGQGQPGPTYGSEYESPLIGGSGGTSYGSYGGGAGGGAILIGSDSAIHISGLVSAKGGDGGANTTADGSGGGIRLASPVISWQGSSGYRLDARGGTSGVTGGDGWTRVESVGLPAGGQVPSFPVASHAHQLGEFLSTSHPTVTVASWWNASTSQWVPMGQDPKAIIDSGGEADVLLPTIGLGTLRLEGHGVAIDSALHVRITDTQGGAQIDSTHTMGEVPGSTLALSWTDVQVDFAAGLSTVQVRAELP